MRTTLSNLRKRKASGEIDGFTLIELLVVIVVLGILAAVVLFALGGVTSKSAIAACQADGTTVNTAIAAFNAGGYGTPATQALLLGTTDGGPYVQSWPSNGTHYAFSVVAGALDIAVPSTGTAVAWVSAATSCASVS
jgi:prepilin-type N-terminal cleavage/methylation domain-containing protein